MPSPVSVTVSRTWLPVSTRKLLVAIESLPQRDIASRTSTTRLITTCSICPASAITDRGGWCQNAPTRDRLYRAVAAANSAAGPRRRTSARAGYCRGTSASSPWPWCASLDEPAGDAAPWRRGHDARNGGSGSRQRRHGRSAECQPECQLTSAEAWATDATRGDRGGGASAPGHASGSAPSRRVGSGCPAAASRGIPAELQGARPGHVAHAHAAVARPPIRSCSGRRAGCASARSWGCTRCSRRWSARRTCRSVAGWPCRSQPP
jgi:hypothetical protein